MKRKDKVLGAEIVGGLREDEGLEALLGYRPPAPETARQWLDKFHDDTLMIGQPLQGFHTVGIGGFGWFERS